MDNNLEMLLSEVRYESMSKLMNSLDEKVNRLRESYKYNQVQIKQIESKMLDSTFKESNPIQYARFVGHLEILRNREAEIAYEGKHLKEEKESLFNGMERLKAHKFLPFQFATHIVSNREKIECNVGSKCLRLAEFLFSSKTCNEVFYPNVGDWREDYIIALRKGRILDASFVAVKIYLNFVYTMVLCSKAGRLIEFIMKLADIIEFFNKFSK